MEGGRRAPVPFLRAPFATPFGRFAASLFGGLFVVQSAIVVAGAHVHGTFAALPLAGMGAALTALSVLAACAFGDEFGQRLPLLFLIVAGSLVPLALGLAQYNNLEPTGVFQNPGERARVFSFHLNGNETWISGSDSAEPRLQGTSGTSREAI